MLGSRRSRLGWLALTVAVLVPLRANAQQCKTDGGPFQSNLQPPPACTSPVGICTLGTLDGQHPETYYFVMDYLFPAGDPTQPNKFLYGGHSVITRVHGGATLVSQDTGVLYFDGVLNPFVTTVNVVGGTKQYADATGQFVAAGQINFVTGAATGIFTSTVCK